MNKHMITRREFSKTCLTAGAAMLAKESAWPESAPNPPAQQGGSQKCDLLIKGGTVIDPSEKLHAVLDVAVLNGKILEVSPDISADRARQVVSAKGKIVTPGLIDVHVHAFDGVGTGTDMDRYCLGRGVTTAVDAGSAGYPSIAGLRKFVINPSATRIKALVDISAVGVVVGVDGAMENLHWLNPQLTAKAVDANKPAVVGIKIRLAKSNVGSAKDLECLRRAVEAAQAANVPIMAHIDESFSPLPSILKMMRKGDIFTHCFNGHANGILDNNGKLLPEVLEARQRGVLFDTAQGVHHLAFDVTEKCLQQNFLPDTIGTDLSVGSVRASGFDLPSMVSKFLALGMDLDRAIERVTIRPARVFDYGLELGTLRPGNEADIAIFELREGQFEFFDSEGQMRMGRQNLLNAGTVRRGQLYVNSI
jgi:dihydroorotase